MRNPKHKHYTEQVSITVRISIMIVNYRYSIYITHNKCIKAGLIRPAAIVRH